MAANVEKTLDAMARLAGLAEALPGRYGRAAGYASAALGLAAEIAKIGGQAGDVHAITRVVDLRSLVRDGKPSR